MPTLEEVYEQRLDDEGRDDRPSVGVVLLVLGVFMVVFGGFVAFSETLGALFGASAGWERWGVGAVFAGVGLPVAFTGVFVVVPAPVEDKVLAAAGILVCLIGVLLFDYAYPTMWHGNSPDLSPAVFGVYALGSFLTFGALFRSVLDIEIPLPRSSLSFEYSEKANESENGDEAQTASGGTSSVGVAVETETGDGHDAEFVSNNVPDDAPDDDHGPSPGFAGDAYCGNCAFYDFVNRNGESLPYCGYHDEKLDNLEACDAHEMRLSPARE